MKIIKYLQNIVSSECYIRTHFNLYCPGCGGSRAAIVLLHGDIIQSVKFNPITLLFLMDIFLLTIIGIFEKKCKKKYLFFKFRLIINVGLLIFIIIYSFLRNYLWLAKGIDLLGDFS